GQASRASLSEGETSSAYDPKAYEGRVAGSVRGSTDPRSLAGFHAGRWRPTSYTQGPAVKRFPNPRSVQWAAATVRIAKETDLDPVGSADHGVAFVLIPPAGRNLLERLRD